MTLREQYIQNNPAGLEWDKWLESRLAEAYKAIFAHHSRRASDGFQICIHCNQMLHDHMVDCIVLKATPKEGK